MRTIVDKYETLQKAIFQFKKALTHYQKVMNLIKSAQLRGSSEDFGAFDHEELTFAARESVIQRFEYNVDMLWKYVRLYLEDSGKSMDDIKTPKHIIREAAGLGLISETDSAMLIGMIGDRNLTSHIYREEIAVHLVAHAPEYYALIERIAELKSGTIS